MFKNRLAIMVVIFLTLISFTNPFGPQAIMAKTLQTSKESSVFTSANSETTTSELGEIVFVSNRDGNYEIYKMKSDGTETVRLTNTPGLSEANPNWSPDGTKIAYDVTDYATFRHIYVMNADGSSPTYLSDGKQPDWSPDGSKIVFSNNYDIYVMNSDGSNITRLTTFPQTDDMPAWSPDGTKIAFYSAYFDVYTVRFPGIYVMDTDGANVTPRLLDLHAGNPAWSPDGTKIALDIKSSVTGVPYLVAQIYINPGGRITEPPAKNEKATWAPDGNQIAFVSDRDGSAEIYVMNADGTAQTRITNNTNYDSDPDWKNTPPAMLTSNYVYGKPGSYFNLTGGNFPPDQTATVSVNGITLGNIQVDANGNFTITLTTSNADQGVYLVTVSVNPSASVKIYLNNAYETRLQDGNFTTLDLPAGIARQEVFLPFVNK